MKKLINISNENKDYISLLAQKRYGNPTKKFSEMLNQIIKEHSLIKDFKELKNEMLEIREDLQNGIQ